MPVVSSAVLVVERPCPTVPAGFVAGVHWYTLTVRNDGDAPSRPTVLDDALSAALSELSTAPPMEVNGRTVRWRVPPDNPGEAQSLLVRARLSPDTPDGATVRNQVALGSSSANAEFVVINRPSLASSTKRAVVNDPFPGARVTYEIEVVNDGAQTAREIRVEDALPPELILIGANPR